MSLRLKLGIQRGLRLDLAEKNMPEQKMGISGVRMALEILANGTVRLGELALLEKGFGVGEKGFGQVRGLRRGVSLCRGACGKGDAEQSRNKEGERSEYGGSYAPPGFCVSVDSK